MQMCGDRVCSCLSSHVPLHVSLGSWFGVSKSSPTSQQQPVTACKSWKRRLVSERRRLDLQRHPLQIRRRPEFNYTPQWHAAAMVESPLPCSILARSCSIYVVLSLSAVGRDAPSQPLLLNSCTPSNQTHIVLVEAHPQAESRS